jgi:hypothetical protein
MMPPEIMLDGGSIVSVKNECPTEIITLQVLINQGILINC